MEMLAAGFWETIIQWDQSLFKKINSDWANPLFDAIMPFLRNSYHWLPLYIFIIVFVLLNFKTKGAWWIVFFLCTVALTDMTGTYVFKHNFNRLRPCTDPDFYMQVRLVLNKCAGGSSFTSNHAANHFGMTTFFFITFRHLLKKWGIAAIIWAASIAYAQVYVGVHYPLDVLAGGLIGIVMGITTGALFNKRFHFVIFDNQSTL